MKLKIIFFIILFLTVLYPAFSAYLLDRVISEGNEGEIRQLISSFQLSVWLSWLLFAGFAIYYKWTFSNNIFFYATYIFLFIGFVIYGYYVQTMINMFNIETGFEDHYTFGVLISLRNFAVAGILTGFLQISVWWFTRRWHRR